MNGHTIILFQKNETKASRGYNDYESPSQAAEDLIRRFESKLKDLNPRVVHLNYGVDDVYRYIDSFPDIVAFV